MIDQYLRNAMDDLAEVKKETAAVMAAETRAKRALDEANAQAQKYTELAKKAITAGNDGDAKVFIAKKQEIEVNIAALQKTYDTAHGNAVQMRQLHDKLTNDINSLKSRREKVKGQMAVAKTQEKINKISDTSAKISGTMGAFSRMEEKAQRALDEANAAAELNVEPVDEADVIAEKYSGVNSSSVDDELARLKAEMGV
jgi:phage shock protein A